MKINLSKRLQKICELITYPRIADIGCDHGKVVAKCFLDKKINYAIVSDISKPSAMKAKELLQSLNIASFDMRVGDGLKTINALDCIDEVIIAGMGADEIINILKNTDLRFKEYILAPQHNEIQLKKYLIENGFRIDKDYIVFDKKFYTILKVSIGKNSRTEEELILSPDILIEDDYIKYLDYRYEKLDNILKKTANAEFEKELEIIKVAKSKLKRNKYE